MGLAIHHYHRIDRDDGRVWGGAMAVDILQAHAGRHYAGTWLQAHAGTCREVLCRYMATGTCRHMQGGTMQAPCRCMQVHAGNAAGNVAGTMHALSRLHVGYMQGT